MTGLRRNDHDGAARREWADLTAPTASPGRFSPELTAGLPAPVRRWLGRAVAPGAALLESAELTMHGRIRVGAWRRFSARQVIAPPRGFVWSARTRMAGFPVTGYDRYGGGTGESRWRLLGVVPVVSGSGPDVTRSAAGRLACEIPLVPAAALGPSVTWEPGDERHAVARVRVDGEVFPVTFTVSLSGVLESVCLARWGDPDHHGYRAHAFGAAFEGEVRCGAFTLPRTVRAGWWYGSGRWREGEFIHFIVEAAVHR
ncbi:DUF6544 family protein [Streptomyces sp. NPDC001678]|uniref:DUF6544 family protein n=1 Tax=Streptomyces sp. NPDC001678 TaxID=3364599 RepID=UPI0036A177EF